VTLSSKDFTSAIDYLASRAIADEGAAIRVARMRVRKVGSWCYFCGSSIAKLVRCSCDFPESMGCLGKNTCTDCAAAHRKIANHVTSMLRFPRVRRVDSRKAAYFRMLREAAEAVEKEDVDSRRVDLFDTLECKMNLDEYQPWEVSSEELRKVVLGSFRAAKFTRFLELAAALDHEVQNAALMSVARFLKSCR
jgi:hypothetical protein